MSALPSLVWVFGGTGVGKRWFINQAINRYSGSIRGALWLSDRIDLVVPESGCHLVRWQWRREREMLHTISHRTARNSICRLTCDPKIQLDRVNKRRNKGQDYEVKNLEGEANNVARLCNDLAAVTGIHISVIDTSVELDWESIYENIIPSPFRKTSRARR